MSQPPPHAPSQDTLYTGLPSRSIDFALRIPLVWYNRLGLDRTLSTRWRCRRMQQPARTRFTVVIVAIAAILPAVAPPLPPLTRPPPAARPHPPPPIPTPARLTPPPL